MCTETHPLLNKAAAAAAAAAHMPQLHLQQLPTTTNPSFSMRPATASERGQTQLSCRSPDRPPAEVCKGLAGGMPTGCCNSHEPAVHVQATQLVNTLNMLRRRAPSDWTAVAPTALTYPEARVPPRESLYRLQGLQGRSSSSSEEARRQGGQVSWGPALHRLVLHLLPDKLQVAGRAVQRPQAATEHTPRCLGFAEARKFGLPANAVLDWAG